MLSSDTLPPDERVILERLGRRPSGLSWRSLNRLPVNISQRVHASLKRRGLIMERAAAPRASRRRNEAPLRPLAPALGPAMLELSHPTDAAAITVVEEIRVLLDRGVFGAMVLQASQAARLAILVAAVRHPLERKRRVLVLTGEVQRALEIVTALRHAGIAQTAAFHGQLPIRERALAWDAVGSEQVSVLVGTRSAGFVPLRDLGLVWVDGEDDPSLKEEQAPRYHAREVARQRAELDRAVLVLASSHPGFETLHAVHTGLAALRSVASPESPVPVEVVDLRRYPAGTLVSPPVVEGVRRALTERQLVLLYLNRKGYAPLLLCRGCGQAPTCPACGVALGFYRNPARLRCHYCGHGMNAPDSCLACQAPRLEPVGAGTERVDDLLRQHFPQIRIARMDSDTVRRRGQAEALLALAHAGEIDVLIGTQMLLSQQGLPRAGLVGVLYADGELHRPDFRSAEYTHHALQDALALARSDGNGQAIIQTYLPHHHAILAASRHDPALFVDTELAFRQMLQYPPFSHLIRLDVSGASEQAVTAAAQRWAEALRQHIHAETRPDHARLHTAEALPTVSVLGPVPAPLPRLRRRYHWQLLVKSSSLEEGLRTVRSTLGTMDRLPQAGRIKLTVDVDPVTML